MATIQAFHSHFFFYTDKATPGSKPNALNFYRTNDSQVTTVWPTENFQIILTQNKKALAYGQEHCKTH